MEDFTNAEDAAVAARINRQLSRANRFDNYRELTAKYPGTCNQCKGKVKKGDRVGWNKRYGVVCPTCWNKWVAENAEADAIEAGYMPQCL